VPRYSSPPPQAPQPPAHQPGRVLRAVALTAVSTGVLILAAAAFVFSYSGIHAVAQQAGISATLARGYPVIFDALLVVACAAVLSLRGAGAVSKFYAWLSLLVLLGATAGADALHSTGTVVPHRAAALVAAIIPWILLLIGFGLLLAMLRHFRLHRAAPPAPAAMAPAPARGPQEARRPAALPPGPTQPTRPPQLPAAAKQANAEPPPGTAAPAPAVPGPAVPVPAAPVPAPAATAPAATVSAPAATAPAVPVPAPAAAAPAATVSAPAATAARPAADRPSPGGRAAADVPPVIVPPQARSEPPHRPEQAGGGPAAGPDRTGPDGPAEPDLADVDGHGDSGDRPAGGGDAVAAPEEIFAAPPADAGPADAGPADAGPADAGPADAGPADAGPADAGPGDAAADPGDRAGRAAAPQPAFHRMWSSPTPPGEEDEG
jgi:Protein of unknown function (DUF2637)